MIQFFLDKDSLFHYIRRNLFAEKVPLSSLVVIEGIHDEKFEATISQNTPFALANYSLYKLRRENQFAGTKRPEKEMERKILQYLELLFEGNWKLEGLDFKEFKTLFKSGLHFEDAYQYKCAKKESKLLLTHNVQDFQVEDIKVQRPRDFVEDMVNKKVLSRAYINKIRSG